MAVTTAGTLIGLCLFFGWSPPIMLLLLYVLYLSIVTVGQDFLGFGWEGFLLETTAHAFLISLTPIPNTMVWVSVNFLLFRFHVQAGAVKFQSRDVNWRNLKAIAFHYQTQPLPNKFAWYIYKWPLCFHKVSCLFMHVAELIIPFGIFLTDEIRLGVFVILVGLQVSIWATGNLSFLNHLTVVLCTILIPNFAFQKVFRIAPTVYEPSSLWFQIPLTLCGTILLALQVIQFYHHFFANLTFQRILRRVQSFYLTNRYGIFAIMTTKRYEIVVEGSADGITWKEYTFKYKPSEITRPPRRISPYQPRIDWQAWFLPFDSYESSHWFQSFLYHILIGTPDVLKLLRDNPFQEHPPKYVRAIVYDYVFSSATEKKTKGWWWCRTFIGNYSPVLSLKDVID